MLLLWPSRLRSLIIKLLVCFKCAIVTISDLIYHMKRVRRFDDKMMPDARFVVKVKKKKRPFGSHLDFDRVIRGNRTTRMKKKAGYFNPM